MSIKLTHLTVNGFSLRASSDDFKSKIFIVICPRPLMISGLVNDFICKGFSPKEHDTTFRSLVNDFTVYSVNAKCSLLYNIEVVW